MNKSFQIAVILTVPASSYQEALEIGGVAVDQCGDVLSANPDGLALSMKLETYYERDGSELNQRVLYLHDEEKPLDEG